MNEQTRHVRSLAGILFALATLLFVFWVVESQYIFGFAGSMATLLASALLMIAREIRRLEMRIQGLERGRQRSATENEESGSTRLAFDDRSD